MRGETEVFVVGGRSVDVQLRWQPVVATTTQDTKAVIRKTWEEYIYIKKNPTCCQLKAQPIIEPESSRQGNGYA